MTVNDQHYSEELADLITSAMTEKGLSIRDLSSSLEITYEHARRLAKGFPPSKPLLRAVCALLELDFDVVEEIAVRANIRRKFGDIQIRAEGKNPEMEPIERAWKYLTEDQKQDAVTLIQGMAKRSKHLVRA